MAVKAKENPIEVFGPSEKPVHTVASRQIDEALLPPARLGKGRYRVLPIVTTDAIRWIDAAGYVLVRSNAEGFPFRGRLHRQDFTLRTDIRHPYVERDFAG